MFALDFERKSSIQHRFVDQSTYSFYNVDENHKMAILHESFFYMKTKKFSNKNFPMRVFNLGPQDSSGEGTKGNSTCWLVHLAFKFAPLANILISCGAISPCMAILTLHGTFSYHVGIFTSHRTFSPCVGFFTSCGHSHLKWGIFTS